MGGLHGKVWIALFCLTANLDAEVFFKGLTAPIRILSKQTSEGTFQSATYLVLFTYRRHADEAAYYGVTHGRVLVPEHMDY